MDSVDQVEQRMQKVLQQVSNQEYTYSLNLLLKEDLGISSIKAMKMITLLSEEFNFELSSENDMLDFFNVRKIIDLVQFVKKRI